MMNPSQSPYTPASGYQPPPYPAAPAPQQQVTTNVINQAAPTVVIVQQSQPVMSFTGHIVFACFVFWCCGLLFGLIAFILAFVAQDRAQSGDTDSARTFGRASLGLSIAGLSVGIAVIIIIGVVASKAASCTYGSHYDSDGDYVYDCY